MTTRVLLLRHAETANPTVFHGAESDIGLSPRGEAQVRLIGPIIAGERPTVVVSSNMLRARLTAASIAQAANIPHFTEHLLHERQVGALQGVPIMATNGLWPDTLKRWMNGETHYAPAGAESFDEIAQRVLPVWDRITGQFAGETIAIVAHGIVIRVILLSLLDGYNVADWPRLGRVQNVSVSELVGCGRSWQAIRIGELPNEVSSLNEILEDPATKIP